MSAKLMTASKPSSLSKFGSGTKRVMQYYECLAVCHYNSLFPEEKKQDEERQAKAEGVRIEREQKRSSGKRGKEERERERERARQAELEQKARASEAARKDKELDNELEKPFYFMKFS